MDWSLGPPPLLARKARIPDVQKQEVAAKACTRENDDHRRQGRSDVALHSAVAFPAFQIFVFLTLGEVHAFCQGWSKTEALVKDHTLSGSLRLLVVEQCLT